MKIEEFKNNAVERTNEALDSFGGGLYFKVKFDEIFSDEADHGEHISGSVEIFFEFKNCKHSHIINYGWDDADGFGLEDNDGDIRFATHTGIFMAMYIDLALLDLADEFLI